MKIFLYTSAILLSCFGSLVDAEDAKSSPCPSLFSYKTEGQHIYEADLKGGSTHMPHDLKNIKVELTFDADVQEITATGGFTVKKEDEKRYLISNPDITIPPYTVLDLATLTVKYEGQKAPRMTIYKLNGVQICPRDTRGSRSRA